MFDENDIRTLIVWTLAVILAAAWLLSLPHGM